MHDDFIREHITRAAEGGDQSLTARVTDGCWPGGPADRSEPAALQWLRRWRPARAGTPLPTCSCAAGRCGVCN